LYFISVRDTGIGIEQKDQINLFKAFGKIEDKNNMNTTGVGLGLMISHIMA
jgi:signal transduction histidine kinase